MKPNGIDIRNREFIGTILDDESDNLDIRVEGRYKVHIPTLMPHIPFNQGIWIKNHVNKWGISSSKYGEYGQHFPLQPFTKVVVRFFENDFNTGYADRIVSDFRANTDVLAQDCVKQKSSLKDRDNQYIILKTPKYWNGMYINEETEKEPNSLILIFNRDKESTYTEREAEGERNRRTVFYIDETGVRMWTHDNNFVRIRMDQSIHVGGNKTKYVEHNRTTHIGEDEDLTVHGNHRYHTRKDRHDWIEGKRLTNIDDDEFKHNKGNINTLTDKDIQNWIKQNVLDKIDQNRDTHIGGNDTSKIDGNVDGKISGNKITNVSGNYDNKVSGNITIEASGNINLTANGMINAYSSSQINADAPMIYLNSQKTSSTPAATAADAKDSEYPKSIPIPKYPESYKEPEYDWEEPKDFEDSNHRYNSSWTNDGFIHAEMAKARTKVRDLGPKETTDYELEDEYPAEEDNKDQRERKQIVGKKCDDVTNDYNISNREALDGKQYYE